MSHHPALRKLTLVLMILALNMLLSSAIRAPLFAQGSGETPDPQERSVPPEFSLPRTDTYPVIPLHSVAEEGTPTNDGPTVPSCMDLDVKFVQRTPSYDYDAAQNRPDFGETVTYVAHIANRGRSSSGPFTSTWFIDGTPAQPSATHPSLGVDGETTVEFTTTWSEMPYELKVAVSAESAECFYENNALSFSTDAITLGFWVEQSFYDFYNKIDFHKEAIPTWNGNSFDDWLQRQVAVWNEILEASEINEEIRVDKIVVVEDGALNCNTNQPVIDKTVDLQWGFLAAMVSDTTPAQCPGYSPQPYGTDPHVWGSFDRALIHELNHARYHIDLYGVNYGVHYGKLSRRVSGTMTTLRLHKVGDINEFKPMPSLGNLVHLAIDGELVSCQSRTDSSTETIFSGCIRGADGTTARPHSAESPVYGATIRVQQGGDALLSTLITVPTNYSTGYGVLYREPYFYEDIMDNGMGYSEYSRHVLNRIAGLRARCGNYNAPCNVGEFIDELAPQNALRVVDINGRPVANAGVELFRADGFPVWYGKSFVGPADQLLFTDVTGKIELGASPFADSRSQMTHTYGLSTMVLMLKITPPTGTPEFHFIDSLAYNLGYWEGETEPTVTVQLDQIAYPRPAQPEDAPREELAPVLPESEGAEGNSARIWVSQAGNDTVSALDPETGGMMQGPIAVGDFPNSLVVGQDRLLVTNTSGYSVSIIDPATNIVNTISVPGDPRGIILSDDHLSGYVAVNSARSLSIIDIGPGIVRETLPLKAHPEGLVRASASMAYIVANYPGKVIGFDLQNEELEGWFHIGSQPQAIASRGNQLYVVDFELGLLYSYDLAAAQISNVLTIPGTPHRIAITPDGTKAYISNSTLNNIYVVNLSTLLVDAILDVQSTQWAMDFRATAQTVELLVPLFDSQQIAVIDTQTERIIRMLNSSGNPSAVAYDQ